MISTIQGIRGPKTCKIRVDALYLIDFSEIVRIRDEYWIKILRYYAKPSWKLGQGMSFKEVHTKFVLAWKR